MDMNASKKLWMFCLMALAVGNANAGSVGEELELESKVRIAKLKEELAKTGAVEKVVAPTLSESPKLATAPVAVQRKPVSSMRVVSIFGIAPDYVAQVEIDGDVIKVKKGARFARWYVTDVSAQGVSLSLVDGDSNKRQRKGSAREQTKRFLPAIF